MENHERVLGQARNARRVDIERLVAELAPRPDVPSSVRKVAVSRTTEAERSLGVQASQAELPAELIATSSAPPSAMRPASTGDSISARDRTWPADVDAVGAGSAGVEATRTRPEASRSCPTVVEVAARFGRAPKRREERVRQKSTAMVPAATGAYEDRIRPGADPSEAWVASRARSRCLPKTVKRAVWYRDQGQCAFVSASGRRCIEREFLELHHIHPYALDGPATVGNIALRCRRHNAYEAEVVFGSRASPHVSAEINAARVTGPARTRRGRPRSWRRCRPRCGRERRRPPRAGPAAGRSPGPA